MIDYEKLWSGSYAYRHRNHMMPYLAASIFHGSSYNFPHVPSIIDWGCGQGMSYQKFKDCKLETQALVDVTNAAYAGPEALFVKASVVDARLGFTTDFGYCSDVLEHIQTEDVDEALDTIFLHADCGAFINVGTASDAWHDDEGGVMEMHMTIEKGGWWAEKLKKHGRISFAGEVIPVNNSFFFVEKHNWRT